MPIPLKNVYRFMSEVCLTLDAPLEILGAALMLFHAAAGALDLPKLDSDVITLAVAALSLSMKANEQVLLGLKVRQHDLLDISIKLASESKFLPAEVFAQRRKMLRQKAGVLESVILRVVGGDLETPAIRALQNLEISSPDSDVLRLARIILADLFRSPNSLRHSPSALAGAATLVTLEVLGKLPQDYSPGEGELAACADLGAVYSQYKP